MQMKKVKLIIAFFIMAVCLTLNGEHYAFHLNTFEDGYYTFTFSDEEDYENNRERILQALEKLCKQENVGVFSERKVKKSSLTTELVICGNEAAITDLKSQSIDSGEHKSMFSGSTDIIIKGLAEARDLEHNSRFYLQGSSESVRRVYDTLSQRFELSSLTNFGARDKSKSLVILWIIASAAILLFTAFDIVFQKKECFVRITMGASPRQIIIKNILIDSAVLAGEFLLLSAVLSRFVYIRYRYGTAVISVAAMTVLNALIYLSMLGFTVKKALSNTGASKGLLFLCYLLRSAVIIVLMLSLSVNLSTVSDSIRYLNGRSITENFNGKSFLKLHYYPEVYDKDPAAMIKKTYSTEFDIIQGEYNGLDCAVDFLALDGDVKYLLVNGKASAVLDNIEGFDTSAADKDRIYVLVPDSADIRKEAALSEAESVYEIWFGGTDLPFEAVEYPGGNVLYYGNQTELHSDLARDPVVIYFSEDISKKKMDYEELQISGLLENLMLTADEETLKALDEKYSLNENGMYLTAVSVNEDYEQYKGIIIKKIIILSAISGLMFILGLLIIGVIIRIEYTVNAMELSVKKVLGYPLGKRYRRLFLTGRISYLIGVTVCVTVLKDYNLKYDDAGISPLYIGLSAAIMIAAEMIVELRMICKTEKTKIVKILKGGSL